MIKYDITDLGYKYKGIATPKFITIEMDSWKITDIPNDIDIENVKTFVTKFINNICSLEIPTSLKCNLRCKYCYIDDPRMKNKDVKKEDVLKILQTASELFPKLMKKNVTEKSKAYITSWGAEPFLNIDTLNVLYDFCHEIYGKNNYVLGTSTNATIWNDKISTFFTNIVADNALEKLQISLDGPPNVQNRYRTYINGNPSFEDVKNFTLNFRLLMKELNVKNKVDHFCSTIHLKDENFAEIWRDTADFFSIPNTWHSSFPFLPMRMSGEDMQTEEEINRFIKAQELIFELVKKKQKEGISVIDFYTAKLFGSLDARSRNSFIYCSALNTQIAIDLEGSIYPCHGPITTPLHKPYLWFGNIFEKTLSYQKLVRNFQYQYGSIWTRSRCTNCPVYNYTTGNICWSCAPHNLSVSGNPSVDNINKCIAYSESFKYWLSIAKMNIINPIFKKIPKNEWYSENFDNVDESKNKISIYRENIHYDQNYDGVIINAIEKFKNVRQLENISYIDTWWKMDNYLKASTKQ